MTYLLTVGSPVLVTALAWRSRESVAINPFTLANSIELQHVTLRSTPINRVKKKSTGTVQMPVDFADVSGIEPVSAGQ
jgi:hypothetical protein